MIPAPKPRIEFWHELASTYSYLSAMRVEALASAAGVEIVWKPLLLGPIFRAQGWDTSPFNIYPAKGKYMVRDMERLAAARGLPFRLPSPFPQNSLHAARLALVGHAEGWGVAFTRAAYAAQFARGANIGDKRALLDILKDLGLDADRALARSETADTKHLLRQQTEEARSSASSARRRFSPGARCSGATTAWSRRLRPPTDPELKATSPQAARQAHRLRGSVPSSSIFR